MGGNFEFDPFGLYPKDEKGQANMRLSEIKHGRLAMIAITAFAAQEFVAGTAVVDHAGLFFKPITQVLSDLNPGYYIPPVEEVQNAVVETLEATKSIVPPVEVVSEDAAAVVPPVPAAPSAELIAAKERIVELEAKLSK